MGRSLCAVRRLCGGFNGVAKKSEFRLIGSAAINSLCYINLRISINYAGFILWYHNNLFDGGRQRLGFPGTLCCLNSRTFRNATRQVALNKESLRRHGRSFNFNKTGFLFNIQRHNQVQVDNKNHNIRKRSGNDK